MAYHKSIESSDLQAKINKLSDLLQSKINSFRPCIDGAEVTSNKISEIQKDSDSEDKRKEAFLSFLPLNKTLVDEGFLELIKLRNKLARSLGFKNFIDYTFSNAGLSPDFINIKEFESSFDFKKAHLHLNNLSKKMIAVEGFKPWNALYIKSKLSKIGSFKSYPLKATDYLKFAFKKMAFDVDFSKLTLDIYSRQNKSEWGYSLPVEIGVENRVLANISEHYIDLRVLLHETGHAYHFLSLDKNDHTYNLGVSTLIAEGFANYCGEYIYTQDSFDFFNIQLSEKDLNQISVYQKELKFFSLSTSASMVFDMNLYIEEPDSLEEINALANKAQSLLYSINEPKEDFPWARLVHHTGVPVYLHNYIAGDLFFNDLKILNKLPDRNTSQWILDEILLVSGKYKFEELYQNIFGKKFNFTDVMNSYFS